MGFLLAPFSRAEKRVGRGRDGIGLALSPPDARGTFLSWDIFSGPITYVLLPCFLVYFLYEKAEKSPVRRGRKFVFKLKQIPDCIETAYLLEVGLI